MAQREPNPTWIGIFVLAAGFLGLATVLFVGSMRIFSKDVVFVLYFEESVNGLSVGAPIKFKGVPVGRVSDIRIRFNQDEGIAAVPVFVKVDRGRLSGLGVVGVIEDEAAVEREIWDGLRGQLQLESIITGQLYVELNYVADPKGNPPKFIQRDPLIPEIPTMPSVLARIGADTTDFFGQITSIDYKRIGDELVGLLGEIRQKLQPVDTGALSSEMLAAIREIRQAIQSADIESSMAGVRSALASIERTSDVTREELAVFADEFGQTNRALRDGIESISVATGRLQLMLHPASPVRQDFDSMVRNLARMSEHLADLIEMLERNPAALLRGRPAEE